MTKFKWGSYDLMRPKVRSPREHLLIFWYEKSKIRVSVDLVP